MERTGLAGYFVATAYNLVRMANLVSCERSSGGPISVICFGCTAPQTSAPTSRPLLITS